MKRSRDQAGYRSVTEPGTSCYCIGNSNSQRVTATRYCNAISSHCVLSARGNLTRVGGREKSNKDASLMWRILDCCRNLELIIDACNLYQGSRGCTQLLTVLLSGPSSQRRRVTRVNKLSPCFARIMHVAHGHHRVLRSPRCPHTALVATLGLAAPPHSGRPRRRGGCRCFSLMSG